MALNNSCKFIGNFVEDPEGQDVNDGKGGTVRLLKFRIGVNNRRTQKSTFPQCEIWGKGAELVEEYCSKGDRIAIECELVTDQWKDKETGDNRYRDKYKVLDFEFLGGGKGGNGNGQSEDEEESEGEGPEEQEEETEEPERKPARRGRAAAPAPEPEPAPASNSKGKSKASRELVGAGASKTNGKGKGKNGKGGASAEDDIPF